MYIYGIWILYIVIEINKIIVLYDTSGVHKVLFSVRFNAVSGFQNL